MVESSRPSKLFSALSDSELLKLLKGMKGHALRVVYWRDLSLFHEGLCTQFEFAEKITLTLTQLTHTKFNIDEKLCLNVFYLDRDYYLKVQVKSFSIEEQSVNLELLDQNYREEMRLQLRLKSQIYQKSSVFIKYKKSSVGTEKKVLVFDPKARVLDKVFEELKQERTRKLNQNYPIFSIESDEDVYSFPLEDISINGLSLLVSANEWEHFEAVIKAQAYDVFLVLNDHVFKLSHMHQVYKVEIKNQEKLKLLKAGFSFNENHELKKFMQDKVDKIILDLKTKEAFYEFVKNV